jgi:hypothetical protein
MAKRITDAPITMEEPDMSQVPEELREGKIARAAEELEHERKK